VNSQLVSANTRFGLQLFQQLQAQTPAENVFLSPSSVSLVLAMLYNGASGSTQSAMAQALQLNGLGVAELNQANRDLRDVLASADPAVTLSIANSLWAREGIDFEASFLQRNQTFYQAQLAVLDFANPAAANQINGWVKEKTQGKIPQIVDRLNPADVMYLINAIYFKGNWQTRFDPSQTVVQPFQLADGTAKSVPLMTQSGRFKYLETEQVQGVSLPYGNGRWSMYFLLPKENQSLAQLTQALTPEQWESWMKGVRTRPGLIQIPRFEIEYETNLRPPLTALGMGVAFDRTQADFSQLSSASTYISQAKHKTFVEVNEVGTEAAAVTSIGISVTSIRPEEPFRFVVDRPFLCAIRDNQTGTVLFLGAILDPAS
jgi:serpin B